MTFIGNVMPTKSHASSDIKTGTPGNCKHHARWSVTLQLPLAPQGEWHRRHSLKYRPHPPRVRSAPCSFQSHPLSAAVKRPVKRRFREYRWSLLAYEWCMSFWADCP